MTFYTPAPQQDEQPVQEWVKVTASIDGDNAPAVEAFYNGQTWNGWDNVHLTRDGLTAWMKESGYALEFSTNDEGNPVAILHFPDGDETIEAGPVCTFDPDGTFVIHETYSMDGYCFVVNK